MRDLPIMDLWSLSPPLIPPRNLLFDLAPIGVGTALVESLTSYMMRLASAHSVSVGDFLGRMLADIQNPYGEVITPKARAQILDKRGLQPYGYSVNGVSDNVKKWVHALETATGRAEIRCLTFLPLKPILLVDLFHKKRTWCSLCFEQWRAQGKTIYEPLLWAIKASSNCLVHELPLSSTCPHCSRKLIPLTSRSRPGYCSNCAKWLGTADFDIAPAQPEIRKAQSYTRQVASLLEMLPAVDPKAVRENFHRNLAIYLEQIAHGDVLALKKYMQCPMISLRFWLNGTKIPRFANLLHGAQMLDVPASSFIAPLGPSLENIAAARQKIAVTQYSYRYPRRTLSEVRQALLDILSEPVPLHLAAVAGRLDTSSDRLRRADSKICQQIVERYRRSDNGYWWNKPGATRICEHRRLKEILEHSLNSNEPMRVSRIARSLGYANAVYIQETFPDICAAIAKKIAENTRARHKSICPALKDALREMPPPNLAELSRRLGHPTPNLIRNHEPELCSKIMERYRDYRRERAIDLERKAAAMLAETPVPSRREVYRRLGVGASYVNKYFPSIMIMIAEQHRKCVRLQTIQRHEQLIRDIQRIAAELHSQGVYPSEPEILRCIPNAPPMSRLELHEEVRKAQKSLGISKRKARQVEIILF